MEFIQNIVEYFDELYPVTDSIKKFYEEITKSQPKPAKMLSIGANTGNLEFFLAKQGCDVTGIENFQPLLEAANLKRRNQLMSIRFFTLPEGEISKYLGKRFYNVINILDNRVCYSASQKRIRQLFKDLREILAKDGVVVIQTFNFDQLIENSSIDLPVKSSMRAKLFSTVSDRCGRTTLTQKIQTWNGRHVPIIQNGAIYPLTKDEIYEFARLAGFRKIEFYSDFDGSPVTESSIEIVSVMR